MIFPYSHLLYQCTFTHLSLPILFSFNYHSVLFDFYCLLVSFFASLSNNYNINLCGRSQKFDINMTLFYFFLFLFSYINLKCIQFILCVNRLYLSIDSGYLYHRMSFCVSWCNFFLSEVVFFISSSLFWISELCKHAEKFCLISFHVSVALIFINFCVSSVQFSSLFHIQTRTLDSSI